jgi:uncharacterized protein GlcG (DUF336 family)
VKQFMVAAVAATLLVAAPAAHTAEGIITYKSLAPDVAFDLARAALERCRKDGFQVAVVVIDRFGVPLVVMRDRFAGLDAQEVANGKAWTAAMFGRNTNDLIAAIKSGELSPAIATLPKVRMMRGGLVIEADGSMLGAVGVAGAPGGEKDEACAKAGLAAVQDKLDF